MKAPILALLFTFSATAFGANDTYFARIKSMKPYPGYRTQQLAQALDQTIQLAQDHKVPETCAMLGALEGQVGDIKRDTDTQALREAYFRAFSITTYCGLRFAGRDLVKAGDTDALIAKLREIGDEITTLSNIQ